MAKRFTDTIVTLIVKAYRLHPCPLLISQCITSRFRLLELRTTQATRKYCSHVSSNNNELDKEKTANNLKNSYTIDQSLINAVSTILCLKPNEAYYVCNYISEIKKLTEDEIINVIVTAKTAGVSTFSIRNNIRTLIENNEFLENKLQCIERLNDNINELLPLLNISIKYLKVLIAHEIHIDYDTGKNKIRYLADELRCNIYQLCELIVTEPSIITLSINRIKTVLNVLKEFNYEHKDILDNLWIFKYSSKTIHRRSMTVKLAGLQNIKPWVVRCSIKGLQRYTTALRKDAQLSNLYGSHITLLSKKLKMPEKEVEFYIKRRPNILQVQLDKVDEKSVFKSYRK
ncbi:hypothetical protein KPH14_005834 [Odynerus spinipes]|uniref:Transcription termination factor, mitochondrial n=1 Tax=Odynerus spinipes TaxID=1348599 RepID=A0AAD9VIZ7_9HYME|nr:hypothetical protein KPH14_005834 [Odynerus spinipes]